jgi:adenosylcobinamide-phosphate synthase
MFADTNSVLVLFAALAVDAMLGEYPARLHPVVWIGQVISALLVLAPRRGWWRQLAFGAFLALAVVGLSAGFALAVLRASAGWPVLQVIMAIFLLKASFALRELKRAAERVLRPLEKDDLPTAREALRGLCSRDPARLEREQIVAAVIESLAENASDSFVAPLFYYLLGGVPAAIAYRAVNTLDARVGYRGPFEALGKASARLDDLANFLPARLTAGLLLLAGWLCRLDVAGGWRILRRDGGRTPSPNGGRPMAVMAGLLNAALDKPGVYVLGDPRQPLTIEAARRAWRVVHLAGLLMAGGSALLLLLASLAAKING